MPICTDMRSPHAIAPVLGVLAGLLALSPSASAPAQAGPSDEVPALVVVVRGLRSDDGNLAGALFASASTFPREGHEVASCGGSIRRGTAICRFSRVPAGRYAVAVMHDENANGRFDRGFLGIPQEGYGFSRDARGNMSAPSFESAAFDWSGEGFLELPIQIQYGF